MPQRITTVIRSSPGATSCPGARPAVALVDRLLRNSVTLTQVFSVTANSGDEIRSLSGRF